MMTPRSRSTESMRLRLTPAALIPVLRRRSLYYSGCVGVANNLPATFVDYRRRPILLKPSGSAHAIERHPLARAPHHHRALLRRRNRSDPNADSVAGNCVERTEIGER